VYAGGAHVDLRLDPRAARAAVRGYVAAVPSSRQLASLALTSVRVETMTVTVRASAVAHPPFLSWVTGTGVTVVAEASARSTAG
jgi:hypothetical protein